jgi:hypothetical protein
MNEKTLTGKAYGEAYKHSAPGLYSHNITGEMLVGTYTVTMRDGKVTRIVWEADE